MTNRSRLFPKIESAIRDLNTTTIPESRKQQLNLLRHFIQEKIDKDQTIRLNFICTHNSRRSHLAQIWAQTIAHYFDVKNVFCYSSGTEATALFPAIVETLNTVGFKVSALSTSENPILSIKYAENSHPIIGFSKKLDCAFNPKSEFAAIMTCDSADQGCPFVSGAETRIALTYEDPKIYDNTSQQIEKYHERSLQIATELFHVFSTLK